MTERLRTGNNFGNPASISAKMSNDLTPRKTMLILVIVVGCFAILWPKVFYPMLVGSANQQIKPSPIDKTAGCCDVISEVDVNTIKIMSELCKTIIKSNENVPLSGREIVARCQSAVLETCGIDISSVLQEQVRLGQSVKQILDEIRSLNGSLCLKYNFGVAPWRLGVPHRVTVKIFSNIKQERPLQLRSELVHPAFREKGRAIPQPQVSSPRTTTRVVEGRPGPIPGMRPTLGGAGHVVPPPKQSTGSMGLIMPIYTIGIVIFFTYTVLKIIFKKQPEALYPPIEPDPNFRREVFESERTPVAPKLTREGVSSKLGDAELDQLRQRLRETELAMERIVEQMAKVPLKLQNVVANGNVPKDEEQPSVKVLGMETTASCEGGKKWSRPDSPVLPPSLSSALQEPAEPPQEIFLEGALPAQSHLLVADSATETERISSEEDPAVVLAGKMTLSVISLDSSDNGTDESSHLIQKLDEGSSSNASDEFEKIEAEEEDDNIEQPINIEDSVQQLEKTVLLEQIQNEIKEIDEKYIITELESAKEFLEREIIKNEPLEEGDKHLFRKETEPTMNESTIQINNDQLPNIREKNNTNEQLSDSTIESIAEDTFSRDSSTEGNEKSAESNQTKDLIKNVTNIESVSENINDGNEPLEDKVELLEHIESSAYPESLEPQSLIVGHSSDTIVPSNTLESPNEILDINVNESRGNIDDIFNKGDSVQSNGNNTNPTSISKADVTVIEDSSETAGKVDIVPNITDEKESFEKLNEAISDLSSEFRKEESTERLPAGELNDERDIEYQNENSDNVIDDEEICDINRTDSGSVGDRGIGTLNGENQENSKYGMSSDTLAENDISDEELIEDEQSDDDDEDVEIQEIIEYITDEEEVVEAIILPNETNHRNHLSEGSSSH